MLPGELVCRVEGWPVPAQIIDGLKARVPRDPSRRKPEDREAWTIASFLELPAARALLNPPFDLRRGAQVDLIAHEDGRTVGIEIAELIHEVEALARTQQHKQNLSVAHQLNPAKYPTRASRRTIPEDLVSGKRGAEGSRGAAAESLFADIAEQAIRAKRAKADGYDRTDVSLLLLYRSTGLLKAALFEQSHHRTRVENAVAEARDGFYAVVILRNGSAWIVGTEPSADFFTS